MGRARAHLGKGGDPEDLPRLTGASPPAAHRDVFVFFINADKERNPAAATTLIELLGTP